jgi:hypothetical protein
MNQPLFANPTGMPEPSSVTAMQAHRMRASLSLHAGWVPIRKFLDLPTNRTAGDDLRMGTQALCFVRPLICSGLLSISR